MREMNPVKNLYFIAYAEAPGTTAEIPKAVHRHNNGLLKRRTVVAGGQVRQMVLNIFHLAGKHFSGKRVLQVMLNGSPFFSDQ